MKERLMTMVLVQWNAGGQNIIFTRHKILRQILIKKSNWCSCYSAISV